MNEKLQDKLAALLYHCKDAIKCRNKISEAAISDLLDDADIAEFLDQRMKKGKPPLTRFPR